MTLFRPNNNTNSGRGAHVRLRMGGLCVNAFLGLNWQEGRSRQEDTPPALQLLTVAEAARYELSPADTAAVGALDIVGAPLHRPQSNRAGKGAIPPAFCVRGLMLLPLLPYSRPHCRFHLRQVSAPWQLQFQDKGVVSWCRVVCLCGV